MPRELVASHPRSRSGTLWSSWRCGLVGLLVFTLLGMAATSAAAQETGRILGQTVEVGTDAPLSQVQVYLPEAGLGTITRQDGQFVILNVPPGSYEVRAERVGLGTVSRQVTVAAGEAARVDFELETQALGLDELVVTGEAGAARRREVGHSVSQVNTVDMVEPPRDFTEMMGGRLPGAVITEASGQAGSGDMIRLRGINSLAMSNTPLVYIDGVRVRSEAYPKNVPPVGYSGRSGNVTASPLSDINPQDIERVEVIKGSAATALYGTEASAGVIQVFTKRGTEQGRPQYSVGTTQSLRHVQKFGAENYEYIDSDGEVLGNSDYMYMDRHWLRDAWGQEYFANVRGGLEGISYFLSGTMSDVDYPLPNDNEKSFALRGNLGFSLSPNTTLDWVTSYTRTNISNTPAGDNAQGVTLNAWRPTTSYTGAVPTRRENINDLLNYEINTYIDHFNTGMTARHSLGDWLNQRFTIGFDRAYSEGRNYRPYGFNLQPDGRLAVTRWVGETLSLDYVANVNQSLGSDLTTTLSVGGQVVETDETSVTGNSDQFPSSADATLSSGAVSLSFEDRIRIINAGFFVQDRLGFRDRLFLTLGLRVDGNSAFGTGLGLQPYPKATLSYVISDESLWNPDWGTLKLRAAYGQAGRAPGAFDAVRTWSPVKISGTSGFLPENPGNPELGPERTSEIELGFTGSFLSNRLAVDFTFYNQTTTGALFPVRTPPSGGDWDAQLQNVGELRNRGIELSLDGTVLEQRDYAWDLGLMVYTNSSLLVDLGAAPEFSISGAYLREGEPAPVKCGPRILNPDEYADPEYDEDYCWGPTQPTMTLTPSTTLRLPGGLSLSARGEYMGGHYIEDANTNGKISRGETYWPGCIRVNELYAAEALDEITARERNRCLQEYERNDTPMNRGDFFKLRDVSLRIPLQFVPNVTNPTLTLSGRNLWKWLNSDWWVLDPEIGCNTGADCLVYSPQEHLPPPATFTASLRFGF